MLFGLQETERRRVRAQREERHDVAGPYCHSVRMDTWKNERGPEIPEFQMFTETVRGQPLWMCIAGPSRPSAQTSARHDTTCRRRLIDASDRREFSNIERGKEFN